MPEQFASMVASIGGDISGFDAALQSASDEMASMQDELHGHLIDIETSMKSGFTGIANMIALKMGDMSAKVNAAMASTSQAVRPLTINMNMVSQAERKAASEGAAAGRSLGLVRTAANAAGAAAGRFASMWRGAFTGLISQARQMATSLPRTASLATGRVGGRAAGIVGQVAGMAGLAAGGGGILGLAAGIGKSIRDAGNLVEAVNKIDSAAGSASGAVKDFASKLERDFGIGKKASIDAAGQFNAFGKNILGLSGGALSNFDNRLVQLAADMMSFDNISFDEAVQKIRAGLSGEAEPLKQLGIIMDEDTIKAYAYSMGIARAGSELTAAQKVQARYNAILAQSADRHGDLAKTADSPMNQLRAAWGRMQAAITNFGTALLPAVKPLISGLAEGLGQVNEWVTTNQSTITEYAQAFISGFTQASGVLGQAWDWLMRIGQEIVNTAAKSEGWHNVLKMIGDVWNWISSTISNVFRAAVETISAVWNNWTLIIEETTLRIMNMWTNFKEGISWAVGAIGQFLGWFSRNWKQVFIDIGNFVMTVFKNLGANMYEFGRAVWNYIKSGFDPAAFNPVFSGITEGFQSSIKEGLEIKGPQFTSIQGQLDDIHERMVKNLQEPQGGGTGLLADVGKGIGIPLGEQAGKKIEEGAQSGVDKAQQGIPKVAKKAKKEGGFEKAEEYARKLQAGAFSKTDQTGQQQVNMLGKVHGTLTRMELMYRQMLQRANDPLGRRIMR